MNKLTFLTTLLTSTVIYGRWDIGQIGIDHMYNDLTSFNVSNVNPQSECFQQCNATNECMGWVVIPAAPDYPECGTQAICYLKSAMLAGNPNNCRISGYVPRSIIPQVFETMPVGTVIPTGWLANQLQVQADGLTGYLPYFWADIENSSWVGGSADGGLHERAPYWLNGLVPLSFLTNDTNLIDLRTKYINYIIDNQQPSGWIGLDDMPTNGDQYWSRFNVVLSLIQYYEGSGDARAITCIFNYLGEANRRMNTVPVQDWAAARAQDFIMALYWLVDNFDTLPGVPANYSQAFLIDLADVTHTQAIANGADWKTWYDTSIFPEGPACVDKAPCEMRTHGVNIGQALKSEAVWYRRSQDLTDIASTYIRINKLDTYHGVANGMYQADEHLAGNEPMHGTETCAVVEAITSYAQSGAIIGDPYLFERAERVIYNAMPASMTKNMWERVYLQQSNEIYAITENPHVFYTDGGDAALYSLEGNYGCCTANMHAGNPKGVYRAVGFTTSGTVGVFMWMPLVANTPYATIEIVTDYPFGDTATVTVTPVSGSTSAVPVLLRIPSWASAATISINGGNAQPLTGSNGTFFPTSTVGTSATTFTINFNPSVRLETFVNGSVAVLRGALLYSVWIGQNISATRNYAYDSQDLVVTAPAGATPWNIALVINDRSNPSASFTFNNISPVPPVPFNSTAIPISLSGYGRVVNNWGIVENAADVPPVSPACSTTGACGDQIPITLVPYGSTHIRMSILPTA